MIRRLSFVAILALGVSLVAQSSASAVTGFPSSQTITVGAVPGFIAVTPNGRYAYVTNFMDDPGQTGAMGSVSVIDTSTGVVTETIPADGGPTGVPVTADGGSALVTLRFVSVGNLLMIDTATHAVVSTTTVTTDATAIVASPDGQHAWFVSPSQQLTTRVQLSNGTFTTGGPSTRVVDIAATPDGTRLFVSAPDDDHVVEINPVTLATVRVFVVGSGPASLAMSADGRRLYAANAGPGPNADSISVIDLQSNTVTSTFGLAVNPGDIAISGDGQTLAISTYLSNTVSLLDTGTGTISETYPTGPGPAGMAFTPDDRRLFIANNGGNSVTEYFRPPTPDPQAPKVAPQQYGIEADGTCGADVPDSVRWPGLPDSLLTVGWAKSWAQWPRGGTGGFVCTRQPY